MCKGREAENYQFTSALPVTLLKLLAPTILAKLDKNVARQPPASGEAIEGEMKPHKEQHRQLPFVRASGQPLTPCTL
jgi:hypothetical protein